MRKTVYQAAVALIALAALIYGRPVSFPDNVHTLHGLPLNWGGPPAGHHRGPG